MKFGLTRVCVVAALTVFVAVAAGAASGHPAQRGAFAGPASGAAATFAAAANTLPRPFQSGDLFAATSTGSLNWYAADGTFVAELATGLSSVRRVEADPSGRLWALSNSQTPTLSRIDTTGAVTIISPVGETATPSSLTFDAAGNVYVADYDYGAPWKMSKLSPSGVFLGAALDVESSSIDLAADQCTMYLQRLDSWTERWNACTGVFIDFFHGPDDPNLGESACCVRALADGSVLIGTAWLNGNDFEEFVKQLSASGSVMRTYSFPECEGHGGLGGPLALSPDGGSFYARCGLQIYEVDVATGARLRQLPLGGAMTVMAGFRAAASGTPLPPPPAGDSTPPTITIAAPVDGASYTLGTPVTVDYACADTGGSGLASCLGSAIDGAALDTATVGTKTVTVTAYDLAGNTLLKTATYQVVLPTLSVTDAVAVEGGAAELVVSLSEPGGTRVTVRYALANGSARATSDFLRAVGTLTFAPGETSKSVTVQTVNDSLYEVDETALLNLSSPVNATVADGQGVVTIASEDPVPSLSISDTEIVEGPVGTTSQLRLTVRLSEVSGVASRVTFATQDGTATAANRDYRARTGSVQIRAGSTTAMISISIVGDAAVEPDETLTVILTAPVAATIVDGTATATIHNDD